MSEVTTPTNPITTVLQSYSVDENLKALVQETFADFFNDAQKWAEIAKTINVTDASQTEMIAQAGEARKQMKRIRLDIEGKRKDTKEAYLKTGQMIDEVARTLTKPITEIEKHLEEQEKFVQRMEQERIALLRTKRIAMMKEAGVENPEIYDPGNMPDAPHTSDKGYAVECDGDNLVGQITIEQIETLDVVAWSEKVEWMKRVSAKIDADAEEQKKQDALGAKDREKMSWLQKHLKDVLDKPEYSEFKSKKHQALFAEVKAAIMEQCAKIEMKK